MDTVILTQERLKELLNYDKETGIFTYLEQRRNIIQGDTITSADTKGYLRIKFKGLSYKLHRLAWLWVYGEIPRLEIDHINGIRSDNRIINLRATTRSENQQNRRKESVNNKSGFLGVDFNKAENKYRAHIKVNGKQKYLGTFDTPELAHQTYLTAKRELHSSCTI